MDDSHGKEISLQYVTVKVPGQKPRGSRGTQLPQQTPAAVPSTPGVAPGANGVLNEPITAGKTCSHSPHAKMKQVVFVPALH